jgi:hypothetical protein
MSSSKQDRNNSQADVNMKQSNENAVGSIDDEEILKSAT